MAIASVSAIDPHACPCLSVVDALPLSGVNFRSNGDLGSSRRTGTRKLRSSFVDSLDGTRLIARSRKQHKKKRGLVVVDEIAGQYDDGFEDVQRQIVNYFTYKATRTVLHQLYEMNPPKYSWFYNFLVTHSPGDGNRFLRILGKEKQDLAERVMITRLHLYGKWIKKCDHARMYQKISDENLSLMRERLMETVIWPSDDTNTEKIG